VVIGVWDILAGAGSNAPLAVQAALAGQRRAERASRDAAAASLLESEQTLVTSKDAAEGMAAMMGRREPVFRGE
jgi:enoyl-CoA hydratase/carnithine racemase